MAEVELTAAFSTIPAGEQDAIGVLPAGDRAIGLVRLALEGGLTIDRELLPEELRDFVEERLESLLDVPVEYVRAARASNVPDLGGAEHDPPAVRGPARVVGVEIVACELAGIGPVGVHHPDA